MTTFRRLLLAALVFATAGASAQTLEQQVKAAFLFRFLSFVEWPTHGPADAPLAIAVLEEEGVYAELQRIVSGRSVNDRPVAVERLKAGERPSSTHVLFVGRDASAQLRSLASIPALLLVAESEAGLEQGALINFVVSDDRVRFEVSPDEAEARGLRIGARMLSVALRVRPGRWRP